MAVCLTPDLIQNAPFKRALGAATRNPRLKTGADSLWGETILWARRVFRPTGSHQADGAGLI
jgi:hypothetical protein